MTNAEKQLAALVRQLVARQKALESKLAEFEQACASIPASITEEIDRIPGRRIFYTLVASDVFDATLAGQRAESGVANGNGWRFPVSQDGSYVMTHYPLAIWKPSQPAGATNFGMWSPVSSWPVPLQQNPNQDRVDISYEFIDDGSQRNFQNGAVPPILSRPDNLVPLPVPTLLAPNSNTRFVPTFEAIFFDADPPTPTTQGELVVALPGYRIVNM